MTHVRRPQMVGVLLLRRRRRRWWRVRSPVCGCVFVQAAVLERGAVGLAQAVEIVQLAEDGGVETVGEIAGWRTKPRPGGIGASQAAFVRGEGARER